jgi:hypothetical protein
LEGLTPDERREMAAWIDVFGSPALKEAHGRGDDVEWDYLEARLSREHLGFFRLMPGQHLVDGGVPSMDAMEQELVHTGTETMRLVVERVDNQGQAVLEDHGEVTVKRGWLGRRTLYSPVLPHW